MDNWKDASIRVSRFVSERDWEQFHSFKNLAIGLSIEASELLETVLWKTDEEAERLLETDSTLRKEIEEEFADVLFFLIRLSQKYRIDPWKALSGKIRQNEEKYPVGLARGKALKYDKLRASENSEKELE